MLYDLNIAWRNIVNRPVQTLITILVVGLAVALSVTVVHLNDGLQQGIIRASDPFGVLVVGAKGSAQQLVLSTLLLQGNPVGNIPSHIYDELVADPRVALAVPLAMGDNVGNARIIGTNLDFFTLGPSLRAPPSFQLASGRLFAANLEAVLGSKAAAHLGLQIGDRFLPAHGVSQGLAEDTHDTPHTVVGILRPSNTPFDNAVFTTVASVVAIHAHHEETTTTGAPTATDPEPDPAAQLTAILVRPVGFVEQNQIWQEFYTGTEAQAAFPGRELGGLFDLLNQGQALLRMVGYLAAVMAALTLFLAVYSATGARERLLAIMRGLGARRVVVFRIVLFETVLTALLGALVGRLAGYGVALAIATQITAQSAIPITIRYLPQLEGLLWGLPLLLGLVAGLIPAIQAYRTNVVEKLFPA
ncbi:MAG: ABC transporter permease [Caldilineaceae bacterium]